MDVPALNLAGSRFGPLHVTTILAAETATAEQLVSTVTKDILFLDLSIFHATRYLSVKPCYVSFFSLDENIERMLIL